MADLMKGLEALDATIRKSRGGPEGSGLFTLLDDLAVSTLGVPRTRLDMPAEPAKEAEPEAEAPHRGRR